MTAGGGLGAREFASEVRRHVLRQSKRANVGHIGSSLSVADIIAALYTGPLRGAHLADPHRRPRFILGKGHAALAVYVALHLEGILTLDELGGYCADGSLTGVHPEHRVTGIDFSTGSLGQGLSFGVGSTLAARLADDARRVFVLLSDAECNEGSVWEAAMFAGHHGLDGLTAIVDWNGQQALGYVRDIQDAGSMADRWSACGWDVQDVDGHDLEALGALLARPGSGRPVVVLARTTFGKGVSFMERRVEWHYLPMDDEQYSLALSEVGP